MNLEKKTAIYNFLFLFFTTLNKNNISYCVLRNYESLPKSLNGSDLDILVAKKDINNFYNLLNQILEITSGKIITKYGILTPRICILGGIGREWYGIQLDVHEGILPYKTSSMFSANFILKRAKKYNNILVANDEDAVFIAFLKQILNNGVSTDRYLIGAKDAWLKNQHLYVPILKLFYSQKFLEKLNEILKQKNYNINKKDIKTLTILGRRSLTKKMSVKYRNFVSNLSRIRRFLSPPGFTIAMLGTDGSGKTTIINEIWKPLSQAVHQDIHYEHFRPNLLPSIAELFGEKKISTPVPNPHASQSSGLIGSLIRLFYYMLDYIFGYLFKVYPSLVKFSSVWIFDRYYYDYLIDPKRSRIALPSWSIKLMSLLIPKIDLIICLGTNANTIYKRKPELKLNEIERQVKALKDLQESQKRAVWIDTGKSLDVSIAEALTIIRDHMSERYNNDN